MKAIINVAETMSSVSLGATNAKAKATGPRNPASHMVTCHWKLIFLVRQRFKHPVKIMTLSARPKRQQNKVMETSWTSYLKKRKKKNISS